MENLHGGHSQRYDSRLERRLKRRSASTRSHKQNPRKGASTEIGKRPGNAVVGLEEPPENITGRMNKQCGYSSSDYEDSGYNWFLRNFKKDGNFYALVIHHDNGDVPDVIRYGIDDLVPDEPTPEPTPRAAANPALNRRTKGKRILREVSGGVETETSAEGGAPSQRASRSLARNENKKMKKKKKKKKWVTEISGDVPVGRGKSSPAAAARVRKALGPAAAHNRTVESEGDSIEEGDNVDDEYVNFLQQNFGYPDEEYGHGFDDGKSGKSKPGPSLRRRACDGPVEREHGEGSESDDDLNNDYNVYLSLFETKGEDMFYGLEESESDSDLVELKVDLHIDRNSTPFVVSSRPSGQVIDLDTDSPDNDPTEGCSVFKTELLEVLKMPYNSKQHREFEQEVKCRKPILEDRNLRGGSKTYPSADKLGKSYLANFTDFAKVLNLAKNDKHKSLYLLRGFFFWLKNISRDGAFRPWEYPSLHKEAIAKK